MGTVTGQNMCHYFCTKSAGILKQDIMNLWTENILVTMQLHGTHCKRHRNDGQFDKCFILFNETASLYRCGI